MVALDVTSRYELGHELGRGGMGTVYRARDLTTGESVAVKVLQRRQVRDLLRFSREVGVLAELAHPGIARYLGHGELPNGKPALIMEWVEGETLARRMQTRGLSCAEAVTMMRHVADALAAAHALGIVHRDLKPENLMLTGPGFDQVKVIDFGVARRVGDVVNLTRTGMRIGTPCYMSPEQARGEREVDARADVFMLGCVLYECVTGRRAFTGASAQALLSKIILVDPPPLDVHCLEAPAGLVALVTRMMSKDPAVRPPDAGGVVHALSRLPAIPDGPVRRLVEAEDAQPGTGIETQLIRPKRRNLATFVMLMVPPEDDDDLDGDDDTIENTARDNLVRALREEGSAVGLRIEVLANGAILGLLSSAEPRADVALRLVECALSVKRWAPEVGVALSDSSPDEGSGLGATLERGFANLETAAMRAVALAAHGGANVVHLDATTAQLLQDRFTIVRYHDDYQLVAEGG